MNKTYCLLVSLLLFSGCVTFQAPGVKQKITKVDFSHEINKEDALTIAQNYILAHKIPVYTLSSRAQKGTFLMASDQVIDVWKVKFSQKKIEYLFFPVAYEVNVNIKNGDVVHSEHWM